MYEFHLSDVKCNFHASVLTGCVLSNNYCVLRECNYPLFTIVYNNYERVYGKIQLWALENSPQFGDFRGGPLPKWDE